MLSAVLVCYNQTDQEKILSVKDTDLGFGCVGRVE